MYADRKKGLNPAALRGALLVNGGMIAVLATLGAITVMPRDPGAIDTYNVKIVPPLEPLPTPEPVERRVETPPPPATIDQPRPKIERPSDPTIVGPIQPPIIPPGPVYDYTAGNGSGSGGTGTTITIEPPAPVLIDAIIDPRHAAAFQPDYPSRELGLGEEGRVTVRVLIGVDGRVKSVERVFADSDGFFQATRRHALSRWRFTPATRDGVPRESWKQMTVRFQLN